MQHEHVLEDSGLGDDLAEQGLEGLLHALQGVIIPADGIQGFQSIVDTPSSATWTGLWPDRGQFSA
jgi:hypothetical protein